MHAPLALTAALIAPFVPIPRGPISSLAPASTATTVTTANASATTVVDDARCADGHDAKVRVMLMDVRTAPAFASMKTGLGQVIAQEAAAVPGYSVVSADDVRAALDQQANKALAGCDDNGCLAEIAQALDADLVVNGTVDESSDNAAIVSLTLLNAKAIVVVNRVSMTWAGDAKDVPDVVRAAADTLMLDAKHRAPGSIALTGVPAGGVVLVDGVDEAGGTLIEKVAIGPHDVKVSAPGKLAFVAHALVKSDKTTTVAVTLEDEPPSSAWLWLGGAGAVLLGGAAAIGVAYALGPSDVVVHANVPHVGANDVESLRKP